MNDGSNLKNQSASGAGGMLRLGKSRAPGNKRHHHLAAPLRLDNGFEQAQIQSHEGVRFPSEDRRADVVGSGGGHSCAGGFGGNAFACADEDEIWKPNSLRQLAQADWSRLSYLGWR